MGEVYLPDEFRHLRILHKPKVSVGVNTMGDWLELNIDMGELSSADIPKILEAYRQKKAYYRLKSGEFLRLEENGILTVARMIDGLTISKKELESGPVSYTHLEGAEGRTVDHYPQYQNSGGPSCGLYPRYGRWTYRGYRRQLSGG